MANSAVEKIEDAIGRLTPGELTDLYAWLEEHYPQPIDDRLAVDLAGGSLDRAIFRALDDESRGHTRPL